jgi:hypothetical protein
MKHNARAGQERSVRLSFDDVRTDPDGKDVMEARQTEGRQVHPHQMPFLVGGGAAAPVALNGGPFVTAKRLLEQLLR